MTRHRNDSLIVLLKTVHHALRADLERALKDVGLTLPQLGVLASLMRTPGASGAELARAAFVAPQSMAELLQSLERRGLVEREADPGNARVLRITLTREGVKVLGKGGAQAARVEGKLAGILTAAEQSALRRALEKCAAALGRDGEDG